MKLKDGARVAIVGGGPSGSMTGFFLLELAERLGLRLQVDLYESRNFSKHGPSSCNMCAGVVSESLVQTLAAEGIDLPPLVVQRGIDSYVLHTSDLEPAIINTPVDDLRIATVYRGSGPKISASGQEWASFDGYLVTLARSKGVRLINKRVTDLSWENGRPQVTCRKGVSETYDFLVGAVGVNSPTLKKFEPLGFSFQPPPVTKGFICEIHLGTEKVQEYLGSAMHVFLLDIPRLKFAALIPKVEYVTVCLLGEEIDRALVARFMGSPEVRGCFPPDVTWNLDDNTSNFNAACQCAPKINLGPAVNPFADRVALVGDAAVSRLYKDGIGAAYITAKSCAVTAVFSGISKGDFKKHYAPDIRRIALDNKIGTVIFFVTLFYQKWRLLRAGMVRMLGRENDLPGERRIMSRVLWDTFTGSASYRDIFLRTLHPLFFLRLAVATTKSLVVGGRKNR